ncbi:uncharacterized protein LOC121873101 [Homarus americanus]|uniref:uncharacterized protein LOC121873101 n=1 Tax=Homarus americanus TaxID=6706 RepID=UPI001C48AAD7|nr:uncharacterized protein LOC121873101 [Homarus americanus]
MIPGVFEEEVYLGEGLLLEDFTMEDSTMEGSTMEGSTMEDFTDLTTMDDNVTVNGAPEVGIDCITSLDENYNQTVNGFEGNYILCPSNLTQTEGNPTTTDASLLPGDQNQEWDVHVDTALALMILGGFLVVAGVLFYIYQARKHKSWLWMRVVWQKWREQRLMGKPDNPQHKPDVLAPAEHTEKPLKTPETDHVSTESPLTNGVRETSLTTISEKEMDNIDLNDEDGQRHGSSVSLS